MPRVIDVTATGYDANGKQLIQTGACFVAKPSEKQMHEQFNQQIVSAANQQNVDVGSINTVKVDGPKNIHYSFSINPNNVVKATSTKPVTKKQPTGSKKEQAIELFKVNKSKTRKEIIELFVEQLDMTPAGAATYYSTAKKTVE